MFPSRFFETAFRRAEWIDDKRAVAYPIIFLAVYVFITVLWLSGSSILPKHEGIEFSRDFVNVYTAGMAVHEGQAAKVYDWEAQREREHAFEHSGKGPSPEDGFFPWLYPPIFLGVAWALAFMPYYFALAVYLIAGFACYSAAAMKLAHHKKALIAVAAFPGAYVNIFAGQNGFITATLLALGLFLLDEAPVAAGIAFGALSYKPQFFILVPFVLFVGRYWKALWATIASAFIWAALSFAALGIDPWIGFLKGLPDARTKILENSSDRFLGIMHTSFSAVRMFGGSIHWAWVAQVSVAVAAMLVLALIWSQRSSLAIRGASLAAALLLASPYSFEYDQVLLALPIVLLAGDGVKRGFLPFEKVFLFVLWLLPTFAKDYGETYALPFSPPMLMILMYYCWRRFQLSIEPAQPAFAKATAGERS